MNDERNVIPQPAKEFEDRPLVSNISWIMGEIFKRLFKLVCIPICRAIATKKILTHVIVDSDYVHASIMEKLRRFAAN